ncbi:FabD/lysophospholipase-like protein [Tricholoma matsutake]|nr:FabD/lysophospholipase-like protein [Tricholoma matsutake 945]
MSVTVDGVQTLQSLQVPSSDIDNGLYTVKSTIECEQAATDDQIEYRNWFNTPVLDEETIKRLHSIQLLAESCDQGFADVPSAGNWTWFEVGVYVDASASVLKEKEGIKLAWKSHSNRFMSQEYGWSEGILFDRKHKIFGMLSSGFLVVELGPKIAERMVPEFKSIVNDGSGVRGLSALYILRDVMNKTAPEKKTCEIFDMIAGTSAGGLIAIMLGHLEMTVDECITEYETLSRTIFAKYKFGDKLMQGGRLEATGARYDSSILENAFKEFVGKKLGTKDAKLLNEQGSCKVCVMAVRADADNNRGPVFLRSYTNPQTLSLLPDCLVWQAGRATSAAPSYFTPVKVGTYKLVDGGLLANNPLGWLWSELLDVFGPARRTACFLSLGTGIPANQRVGRAHILDRSEIVDGFSSAATNSQLINILFKALLDAYAPATATKKYWRLNVGELIPGTDNYKDLGELDDLTKIDEFRKMTNAYIEAQQDLIKDCASALKASL